MRRLLLGITVCALLGFDAPAQEPAKEPPAAAAPAPGAEFLARFDLDKSGSVTWDEFQKVKSGFAALDANGDGAITQAEIAKVAEERRARMQKAMQQRMRQHMQQGRRGRGMQRGGFGPWGRGRGAGFGAGRFGGFGQGGDICPWCQQPCGQGAMGPGPGGGPRGPMGPGGGRGRGGGMGWGFGARGPWGDAPQEGPPPPPPQR